MTRIYGQLEAVILVVTGVAMIGFASSPHYGLLMNTKFRWLTLTGALLVLGMGVVASRSTQKRGLYNVCVFTLMLLMVWIGKPYLPDARSPQMIEPRLPAGLWAEVDQVRFPRMDLQELYQRNTKKSPQGGPAFTTIGVAKRLPILDEHQSFALMTSLMACCIADALRLLAEV